MSRGLLKHYRGGVPSRLSRLGRWAIRVTLKVTLMAIRGFIFLGIVAAAHLAALAVMVQSGRAFGFCVATLIVLFLIAPRPACRAYNAIYGFYSNLTLIVSAVFLFIFLYGPLLYMTAVAVSAIWTGNFESVRSALTISFIWIFLFHRQSPAPLPEREPVKIAGEDAAQAAAYFQLGQQYRDQK